VGTILTMLGLVLSLAGGVCGIIILIAAFSEEVVQGILCLCVPFYILYYAIVRYQSEHKPIVVGVWLGGLILGAILQGVGTAMQGGG
jgi:hypothetical protein